VPGRAAVDQPPQAGVGGQRAGGPGDRGIVGVERDRARLRASECQPFAGGRAICVVADLDDEIHVGPPWEAFPILPGGRNLYPGAVTSDALPPRRRFRLRRPGVGTVMIGLLLVGVLVAAMGAGYSASRPALGDGSAYVAKGSTVVHVNGETGQSDAEVARALATGRERLQTVRLPDGRVAIVNTDTGEVTFVDPGTMEPTGTPVQGSPGGVTAVPTESDGYVVDRGRGTVERVSGTPGPPVEVPDGIVAAVPAGPALWVLARSGEIVVIRGGVRERSVRVPGTPAGITVADRRPVVVTTDGIAYTVDGAQPRSVGSIGLTGAMTLGSWEGTDRDVLAVDPRAGRFAALDPRSGTLVTVDLKVGERRDLAAPVALGNFAYVPDYAGPSLWRVDLSTGRADDKPLQVQGQAGPFELKVSGGRVWANSQYDRRVLIVDRDGSSRYADKGPGAGVTDSGRGGPGTASSAPPSGGPSQGGPSQGGSSPPAPNRPGAGSPSAPPAGGPRVTVPTFARGTNHETACDRLRDLDLRCDAVAAGDLNGRATNEVIDTNPPGGSQVPARSRVLVRYVGPVRVPDVGGQPQAQACERIRAAGLVCSATTDPAPAANPAELGTVRGQEPAANQPVVKGTRVTLRYPNSIALPSFSGIPDAEACQRIRTQYQMRCVPTQGTPGGADRPIGQVYDQEPKPPAVATIGSEVRLVSYAGAGQLGDFNGLAIADACARVTQAGYRCAQAAGTTAAGTGQAPGTVYAQDPAPGTTLAVGGTVTLTYRSGDNALPSYGGASADAACADIEARGFTCNRAPVLAPNTNVVVGQNPGPGTYPLGSAITVNYSPWALVEYSIYRHSTLNVWALRPTGNVPAGYGGPSYRVGLAYAPGTAIPGGRQVNGFFCTISAARCSGLNPNHFYSGVTSYDADWQGPNPIAVFMTCGGAGARPIYRTWTDQGATRFYAITAEPGAVTGQEQLGCVW
jgi:beta-lactam-binding protein with PASTA domain